MFTVSCGIAGGKLGELASTCVSTGVLEAGAQSLELIVGLSVRAAHVVFSPMRNEKPWFDSLCTVGLGLQGRGHDAHVRGLTRLSCGSLGTCGVGSIAEVRLVIRLFCGAVPTTGGMQKL